MRQPVDLAFLLSSAAMVSCKAETYPPETHVVELAELRQLIFELQKPRETKSS